MINNWNTVSLDLIRTELEAAMRAVLQRHGLTQGPINIKYSSNRANLKFDLMINPSNFQASNSSVANTEALTLRNLNLPLGTVLRDRKNGETYKIMGYNSRSSKRPITTVKEFGNANNGTTNWPIELAKTCVLRYPEGFTPIQETTGGLRRTYLNGHR